MAGEINSRAVKELARMPQREASARAVESKEAAKGRGLFEGFEGYRTSTDADYKHLFQRGLVVPDTNVLLNLYRYNHETRDDFFNVLQRLGNQLWVPHQALVEFWRNRESALRDPTEGAAKAIEALDDLRHKAVNELRTWVNRVALPTERFAELEQALSMAFASATDAINNTVSGERVSEALDTDNDQVLKRLGELLKGHVGEPMTTEDRTAAIAEAKHRAAAGAPPGYMDADKSKREGDERAAGDYLVWEQILREASVRKCDVLLVTGDVKEDWWRRDRGQARGPRLELVDEMHARCGGRLFMLRPESLLVHARKLLEVEVREGSLREVERIDRSTGDAETGGWTVETITQLMDRLYDEASVQWMAICFACMRGPGLISRASVYDLGEYDEARTLRGFTRPANRLAQEFRDAGIVPPTAVDVLQAVYESSVSAVQASGFRVPEGLIPLIQTYVATAHVDFDDYEPRPRSTASASAVPSVVTAARGSSRVIAPPSQSG